MFVGQDNSGRWTNSSDYIRSMSLFYDSTKTELLLNIMFKSFPPIDNCSSKQIKQKITLIHFYQSSSIVVTTLCDRRQSRLTDGCHICQSSTRRLVRTTLTTLKSYSDMHPWCIYIQHQHHVHGMAAYVLRHHGLMQSLYGTGGPHEHYVCRKNKMHGP